MTDRERDDLRSLLGRLEPTDRLLAIVREVGVAGPWYAPVPGGSAGRWWEIPSASPGALAAWVRPRPDGDWHWEVPETAGFAATREEAMAAADAAGRWLRVL